VDGGDMERLIELANCNDDVWEISPQLACKVAEGMIRLGNKEAALEITENLSKKFPRALRPKQLQAHALTRINSEESVKEAKRILGELVNNDHRDPETLGLYAKTWFEEWIPRRHLLRH